MSRVITIEVPTEVYNPNEREKFARSVADFCIANVPQFMAALDVQLDYLKDAPVAREEGIKGECHISYDKDGWKGGCTIKF